MTLSGIWTRRSVVASILMIRQSVIAILPDFAQYPVYLRENESRISAEDKTRYTSQSIKVHELVAVFETPDYKDGDPTYSMEILKLMNEVGFVFT